MAGNLKTVSLSLEGNTTALTAMAELSDTAMERLVKVAINQAHYEWSQLARQRLRSSQGDYLDGLKQPEYAPGIGAVPLVGPMPNAIERGQKAYDMRSTLLGPNVPTVPAGSGQKGKHKTKDGTGFYRFIPFRHTGVGTVGRTGTPMGQAYQGHEAVTDARALGMRVQALAKQLAVSKQPVNGSAKVAWGEALDASAFVPKLKPYHTSNIYQGMYKVQKTYDNAKQNTYMTFRAISTNGDPQKWQRRATQGVHLCEQVQRIMEAQLPHLINDALGRSKP